MKTQLTELKSSIYFPRTNFIEILMVVFGEQGTVVVSEASNEMAQGFKSRREVLGFLHSCFVLLGLVYDRDTLS